MTVIAPRSHFSRGATEDYDRVSGGFFCPVFACPLSLPFCSFAPPRARPSNPSFFVVLCHPRHFHRPLITVSLSAPTWSPCPATLLSHYVYALPRSLSVCAGVCNLSIRAANRIRICLNLSPLADVSLSISLSLYLRR